MPLQPLQLQEQILDEVWRGGWLCAPLGVLLWYKLYF